MCTAKEDIEKAFADYYKDLFSTGMSLEIDACTRALKKKVTWEMNTKLVAEFTVEEISTALNQMPPLKAPGPDGFSAFFYKHNWVTVN